MAEHCYCSAVSKLIYTFKLVFDLYLNSALIRLTPALLDCSLVMTK